MSLLNHYNSLIAKHETLEEQIRKQYSTHGNDNELAKMKKQKLTLKEEINKIETDLAKLA